MTQRRVSTFRQPAGLRSRRPCSMLCAPSWPRRHSWCSPVLWAPSRRLRACSGVRAQASLYGHTRSSRPKEWVSTALEVARDEDLLARSVRERLRGVLRALAACRTSLGHCMSDRSAVHQGVAEAEHLVAVVLIASVRGARRRREAIALLPQPQRLRADVEHPGSFVDRKRGSTLLLRVYRQPGLIPLALVADRGRISYGRSVPKASRM